MAYGDSIRSGGTWVCLRFSRLPRLPNILSRPPIENLLPCWSRLFPEGVKWSGNFSGDIKKIWIKGGGSNIYTFPGF